MIKFLSLLVVVLLLPQAALAGQSVLWLKSTPAKNSGDTSQEFRGHHT